MGVEVYGKTLGLIGAGNIGSIVADRAQGLKMKVIAYDPYLTTERAADLAVEKVELDDLFARADFITLHTPLTDATRGIIDAEAFAKMKQGVFIVNCARGGLVVEADLRDALQSGKVAGAAVDVFTEEPAKENPLFGAERLVATPHLGASTSEAQENVAIQVAEQMADFLTVGAVTNALNIASVGAEDAPKLRPYMTLARQIGGFLGQIADSGMTGVKIDYVGHVAAFNTRPLTAVVLEGLLSPTLDSVNMVNAPVVAKERNIEVTESSTETVADYESLICLTVTSENGEQTVAGTLYADQHPRLVRLNGIEVEAELAPEMLLVTNEDKPGFIGLLGTTLGKAGVNIATFHLGRTQPGGEALALVSVDEPVSDEVLAAIRALPLVTSARSLHFG
jgi:D-3-phosphoglycerate dehydrogenase